MSSYFHTCAYCEQIAKRVCDCSSSPWYLCDDHTVNHKHSNGNHTLKKSLIPLSVEEISILAQAVRSYQIESIKKAISTKNDRVNELLKEIRRAEEECSSCIKSVLDGEIKQTVEQLVSLKSLPLFSSSSFLSTLVFLKQSMAFTIPNISKQISSLSSAPILSSQAKTDNEIRTNTNKSKKIREEKENKIDLAPQWELSHQIQAHTRNFNLGSLLWGGEITCIAVSDCNRFFASASFDWTIKVWDAGRFNLLRCLKGHTLKVTSVSFLGNRIVSGSEDKSIKIWEMERCIRTLSSHSHVVTSVCVSSSKRLIASGSLDKTVGVFDIESNRSLHTLRSHSTFVNSVVFSEDDREIVSAGDDRSIKIWKTDTGELLKTLKQHEGSVLCVRFLGKLIVSSSYDRCIRAGKRDEEESLVCLREHTGWVTNIDACNTIIASISNDNSIRVWDLKKKEQIQRLEGHGSSSICYIEYMKVGSLKILEDGRRIISGGADGRIKVWTRRN